jgi:protein-S-isoprenylcysteine O-methyltransferase Ste14
VHAFEAQKGSENLTDLLSWRVVTTLWAAWLLYWIVRAWGVRRNERGETSGQRLKTSLVLAGGAFLIFARDTPLGVLDHRFAPNSEVLRALGLVMELAGLLFSVWARVHLGKFWSARVTLKQGHELIQSGPYARVRHPIYSGIGLAMLGTALFSGEWRALVGAMIFIVGHWLKSRREEALLISQFGSFYEDYRSRTGSLLPRVR